MSQKDNATSGQKLHDRSSVSIIVPAYNEEMGISNVLTHLIEVMSNCELLYEIIVVDDGSHDSTGEIASRFEDIVVLKHKGNRGYGAALKTGISHSKYELICITDADQTYPNEDIPRLVNTIWEVGCEMVVGSRTGENVHIPIVRRPAKWVIRKLASLVAGESIPDINSGLRVFSKSVAYRFFNVLPNGFSFTATITLSMLTNGYLVEYVPINYHARIGKSKIRPIRDTLNFIQLVLRMALYFSPLKIFIPLSILLLLVALGWALFSKLVLQELADISTLVIAMASVQVAIIGMLAELINQRLPNYYREDL